MITKVAWYRVTCPDLRESFFLEAPTQELACIGVRMDYPRTWGHALDVARLRGEPHASRIGLLHQRAMNRADRKRLNCREDCGCHSDEVLYK